MKGVGLLVRLWCGVRRGSGDLAVLLLFVVASVRRLSWKKDRSMEWRLLVDERRVVGEERDLPVTRREEGNLHAIDEGIGKKRLDLGGCLNLRVREIRDVDVVNVV